ncbi:MAG TPA: PilZ domain-containing protein [Thermoanaerobaculia bacterium]|jgi:hypothetical protein
MNNMLVERRTGDRFSVRVPIHIADGGNGSTIDISASGVAFTLDRPLEPGRDIRFDLGTPGSGEMLPLHCAGRVVRVEPRGPSLFVAATIDLLDFGTPTTSH